MMPPIMAARTQVTAMPRPLWFESPTGTKMYAEAEKDLDGWVVRLFDQSGKRISPILFRISYEIAPGEFMGELSAEIVSDLMHEMRRQVMTREAEILAKPIK